MKFRIQNFHVSIKYGKNVSPIGLELKAFDIDLYQYFGFNLLYKQHLLYKFQYTLVY